MEAQRSTHSETERASHRWKTLDYIIGGTFISASISGVLGALNSFRTNFYEHFVFKTNHKGQPNRFADGLKAWEAKRLPFEQAFEKNGSGIEYMKEHKVWLNDFRQWQRDAIDQAFEIKGSNRFTKAIHRDLFMIKNAGRFVRNSQIFGIGVVVATTLGAIGTMKHAKNISDNMDNLIDRINAREAERDAQGR